MQPLPRSFYDRDVVLVARELLGKILIRRSREGVTSGRIVETGGYRILGLAGSRWYNGGPNQFTEAEMKRILWKLRPSIWWRKGVDIVVSHAPPRHVHDAEDRCHRGFKCFRWLIDHYAPLFFLHGHVHQTFADPAQRITRLGRTRVVNTCGYTLIETGENG